MDDSYDKRLLYAIHHKEQYNLIEQNFVECSDFEDQKKLLTERHGELLAVELCKVSESELLERLRKMQIDLDNRQSEQWRFFHEMDNPFLDSDPDLSFLYHGADNGSSRQVTAYETTFKTKQVSFTMENLSLKFLFINP